LARVTIQDGVLGEEWSTLVNPGRAIPPDASRVHGISDAMVADAPKAAEAGRLLRTACADLPLVFHNAPFDLPFLLHLFREAGAPALLNPVIDTLGLARGLFGTGGNLLGALATKLKLPAETAHRAPRRHAHHGAAVRELAGRWEREKGALAARTGGVEPDVMRVTARR
jgi:DNA polymerase-3 subunit epsilon